MTTPARICAYAWSVRLIWALEMGDIPKAVGAGSRIAAAEIRHQEDSYFDSDLEYYKEVFSGAESPEMDGVVVTLENLTDMRRLCTPLKIMYTFAEYLAFTQDDRGVWTMGDVITRRRSLPNLTPVDKILAMGDSAKYRDLLLAHNRSANYGVCEFAELMYDLSKRPQYLPAGVLIHSYVVILESAIFRFGPQMVNSFKHSMIEDCGVPENPKSEGDFLDDSDSSGNESEDGEDSENRSDKEEGVQPDDVD